ncbi:MAG: cation:proton antiporter [Nanoarchaeota archaeon]
MLSEFISRFFSSMAINFSTLPKSESIIFDIAFILIISAIFAFIARLLKQPLIPAYVITGLLIGPLVFGMVKNVDLIYAFSEIGIAFLLFTAGLEISFKKIKEADLNKIFLIGILQVTLVFLVSLSAIELLNFNLIQSAYIGIILAFSSTMVVVKLLSEKNELVTMHGRLILGILLLQDLFAIFAIILLTSSASSYSLILGSIFKLAIILLIALLLKIYILDSLFKFAARSQELLFLCSLAVLFLFVAITRIMDLSIVIGAFISGILLANSQFKTELSSKISPLRDFFSILFFVALGMQIVFLGISDKLNLFLFLIFGAFLLKPFLSVLLLRIFGYKAKTSFLTSLSLSQLSEFSLIIGMLGLNMGIFDQATFSTIILVTIASMALTTYFIEYQNILYVFFKKPIGIFKSFPTLEKSGYSDNEEKEVILIGAHRMGSVLLRELINEMGKKNILVIDYNPEIINHLINKKIPCLYGELGSPELFEHLKLKKLNLVISTVPNYEESDALIKKIKMQNKSVKVIVTATRISEALELYNSGADYVILPKLIAGDEFARILSNSKNLENAKNEHIKKLNLDHNILY